MLPVSDSSARLAARAVNLMVSERAAGEMRKRSAPSRSPSGRNERN